MAARTAFSFDSAAPFAAPWMPLADAWIRMASAALEAHAAQWRDAETLGWTAWRAATVGAPFGSLVNVPQEIAPASIVQRMHATFVDGQRAWLQSLAEQIEAGATPRPHADQG